VIDSWRWRQNSDSRWGQNSDLTSQESNVFLNVKHLHLVAQAFTNDLDGLVKPVLSWTKDLETLYLCANFSLTKSLYWGHVESFSRTIRSLQSSGLRKIELEKAVCPQTDLLSLLDRHKVTMRDLRLCIFGVVGSLEETMIWIRDHCSLTRRLSLRWVSEYDRDGHEVAWVGDNEFPSDLSRLDELLEQRRKRQAELEAED